LWASRRQHDFSLRIAISQTRSRQGSQRRLVPGQPIVSTVLSAGAVYIEE